MFPAQPAPAHMLTGPPLLLTEWYGIPSLSSCGRNDASKKVEQTESLAAAWPSVDHCCGQRGRPCWKENLPWMDGTKLYKILPLTTSVKQIQHCGEGPKGTHSLIFIYSLSPLISFSLFVIFELRSIYQINLSCIYFPPPVSCCCLPLFSSLIFVAFFHRCTYQFLSPEGFNGFLCAVSSHPDPSSDKYSFQRHFTGSELISGFSSHSLLAGNLT